MGGRAGDDLDEDSLSKEDAMKNTLKILKMLKPWNLNASLVVAVWVCSSVVGLAGAQINRVEPYYAVVTVDQTTLRAGDMPQYYTVAILDAGSMLRVDGAGGGWARVGYPQQATAFAAGRDVKDLGNNTLEVTRPTSLLASSLDRGYGGSWQKLLPQGSELVAGDSLTYTKPVTKGDGSIAAYVISPPTSARAFVESSLIRKATEQEIAEFLADSGLEPEATPTPTNTDEIPAPAAITSQPAVEMTNEPTGEEVISLIDEIVIPGSESTPEPTSNQMQPVTTNTPTAPTTEIVVPVVTDVTDMVTEIVTDAVIDVPPLNDTIEVLPADSTPGLTTTPKPSADTAERVEQLEAMIDSSLDVEHLEAVFTNVRQQSLMAAELGELRDQFQRVRDQLGAQAYDQSTATRIDQRLAVLDVMIDLRDRRRELAAQQSAITVMTTQVERRISAASSRAAYTVVGQLVPSTIYDGLRLPMLYRIVSVDQTGTRTIAYVSDTEQLGLAQKVGRVVGFTGTIGIDPTLGVRLVKTNNVSVLQPGG